MSDAITLAVRLANLLDLGVDQCEALERLGIDEDDVMSEHECLPIGDTHNEVIDFCNGVYVQRHGAHEVVDPETRWVTREGGHWRVHLYA